MKLEKTPAGGLKMDLDAREAEVFRYLVERASFIDTPPEKQDEVLQLAERILVALGIPTGS